jgi:YVTN family beta-propeller protein
LLIYDLDLIASALGRSTPALGFHDVSTSCRTIFTENKMKSSFSSTLRVIAVALIGFASLTVLGGCAMGAYPTMSQVATVPVAPPATPAVIPALLEVLNPTTNMLYVSNATASAVYVFDMASNTVVATIPIGVQFHLPVEPGEMAVNAVTNTIYVINNDGSISVIDGSKNVVSATITVGPAVRIAVNAVTNKIYVSTGVITRRPGDNGVNNNFLVLDGATNKVIGGLALSPSCIGLAVDAQTNTIYATTNLSVEIIDGTTNSDMASIASGNGDLVDVAVDQTTHNAYVVQAGFDSVSNQVFVINGPTFAKTGTIALASASNRVAVNPQTHAVYVTAATSLAIIDGTTNTIVDTVSFVDAVGFGNGPTDVAVNTLTGLVYVTGGSDIAIITPATYGTKDVSVVP